MLRTHNPQTVERAVEGPPFRESARQRQAVHQLNRVAHEPSTKKGASDWRKAGALFGSPMLSQAR